MKRHRGQDVLRDLPGWSVPAAAAATAARTLVRHATPEATPATARGRELGRPRARWPPTPTADRHRSHRGVAHRDHAEVLPGPPERYAEERAQTRVVPCGPNARRIAAGLIGQQRLAALHHRVRQPPTSPAPLMARLRELPSARPDDETERALREPFDDPQTPDQDPPHWRCRPPPRGSQDPAQTTASSAARLSALFRSEMSRKEMATPNGAGYTRTSFHTSTARNGPRSARRRPVPSPDRCETRTPCPEGREDREEWAGEAPRHPGAAPLGWTVTWRSRHSQSSATKQSSDLRASSPDHRSAARAPCLVRRLGRSLEAAARA